jgi:hypothetical protein
MGDGWPQQHHNSNGDNTHVQNRVHGSNNACAIGPGNPIAARVGHNETCVLSLMSGFWVNSGTATRWLRRLNRGSRARLARCLSMPATGCCPDEASPGRWPFLELTGWSDDVRSRGQSGLRGRTRRFPTMTQTV